MVPWQSVMVVVRTIVTLILHRQQPSCLLHELEFVLDSLLCMRRFSTGAVALSWKNLGLKAPAQGIQPDRVLVLGHHVQFCDSCAVGLTSASNCTVLHCIVVYCFASCCFVLYCAVLCCTVFFHCCTAPSHAVLYCTVLHFTVLYCTVL